MNKDISTKKSNKRFDPKATYFQEVTSKNPWHNKPRDMIA
jgi:hypothetical protein